MNAKLTVRLDRDLIGTAKEYAARIGKPVSKVIADLFEVIRNEEVGQEEPLPPTVRSLKGILAGKGVGEQDYRAYLEEKYK